MTSAIAQVDGFAAYMRAFVEEAARLPQPTRSESLRQTMRRFLRGRRNRDARRLIKSQLDWHGRWTAEGLAALYPWHLAEFATIWAWEAQGCPIKGRRWPRRNR